jgi:hypothetical protein
MAVLGWQQRLEQLWQRIDELIERQIKFAGMSSIAYLF